ncbi:MAG: TOTE conflict system archaeo-eukaryotic primase domain-containing protein [Candidatus Cryptobacteroides sp.]
MSVEIVKVSVDQKDKYIFDLESQLQYFKKLLDENGIIYDYEAHLRALQSDVGDIIFPELGPEHASLLYSYFKGRQDVYSLRSSKKGYYTQCNNFWKYGICPKRDGTKIKCQDCSSQDYKELKGRVILQHLQGIKEDCTDVVGLYPLFPDGSCWFLVFDFDNHDESAEPSKEWQQEVNALREMCSVLGIDSLVERSRSGKGAHVWIFFSDPIQASKARKFGESLLRKGAESVSLKNFTYYDRMMPMQDFLPEGKLGNLIALPLQGRALRNGNSAFVDESWNTYKDQWKRLRETRRLSEKEVDDLIKLWCPDDDAMSIFQNDVVEDTAAGHTSLLFGQTPASTNRDFHAEDADGSVKIILSDGIYVNKKGLKDRMQNAIRRIAAYSNPQFFQTLKLGFSTKDTPRIVYNGYDEGDYIVIPRGCYDELISQLSVAGVRYDVVDKRQKGRKIDIHFNGDLYSEQQIAAEKMLYNDIGVLAAATAFGKTVLGAYLIAEKKVNALVLVHNVEIMNNWIKDLSSFLTINEELPTYTTPKGRVKKRSSLIGTFSSQKDSTTGIIDIAMITSLGREDNINELVRNYGMVIVDECHHAAAVTHENVLRAVTARYVYGMSATINRGDKQDKKMFMQLGPIRHRYTAKERAQKQGIGHYIYPRFTRLVDLNQSEDKNPSDYYRLIMQSELRNMQIVSDVIDCVKRGRTPVVMTKYKEHAQKLYDMLQGVADHVFLLQGGKSLKERAAIREQMAAVRADESLVLVAIGQYVGEGFNYPRLDTMLLAMPISFEGNVEQHAGRLNRDYEGKKDAIIFDYIDQHVPTLKRMYYKRLRAYKKIGYEVCSKVTDKQEVANSIFDSQNYFDVFEKDVVSASKSIVISSPSFSFKKVNWLCAESEHLQLRGVSVVVLTLDPEDYPEDGRDQHKSHIEHLISAGVNVITRHKYRERFAIMDKSLVWYGSMTLLSNEKEDDSLMRISNPAIAEELLEFAVLQS